MLTSADGAPQLVLDSDEFLRSVFLNPELSDPYQFCHRPIITSGKAPLGKVIYNMRRSKTQKGGVIENDVVLVWGDKPRIITGADLFDRLLHGIR